MLGYRPLTEEIPDKYVTINETGLPDSIDWRSKNAVLTPRQQGPCGSCWAFSATGSIEGAYAIKYNNLVSFSK